jgi:hypothetical protein
MTEVDFSGWVGKPPARPKVTNRGIHDAREDEEERSLGRKTDSDSPAPESVSYKDVSASPRAISQTHSKPITRSPSYQAQLENGFYIDIPHLLDKEDYEHLPGYFTVQRILREVTPGRYLVKLRSGEVDLVSMPSVTSSAACLPACLQLCQVLSQYHCHLRYMGNILFVDI